MVGFKMDEYMVGTHRFSPGVGPVGEYPLRLDLTWGSESIGKFFSPSSGECMKSEARGTITVGGMVDRAPCAGTLEMFYFSKRMIRYDVTFGDTKGRTYRYVGDKVNIRPWNILKTHFTCYGTITELESAVEISRSLIKFPYREAIPFALSFRLRFNGVFKDSREQ
ncbi:MAG: hypothetical protein PHY31_05750 [Smithellaceae bacterium]|nr:hypothetical protein [Smithellaceae bacterium]